ncbi:MAG TPA: hypothetical protein VKB93_01095 [Thermoanaerobaculia bacterium]|nr:hypothetical protein [Thermoanaerobaculia bacterium]
MKASAADARVAAERLFRSGLVEDRELLETGTIGDPLPVRAPGGAAAGWVIPVLARGRLCSFFQFDARLTLLRYSAFPKSRGPEMSAWSNPVSIALAKFPDALPAGEPYLSYDRDPSRVVWAVPVRGERVIFVAGDYAYLPSEEDGVTG